MGLAIRAAGLILVGIAWLSGHWLGISVRSHPGHDATGFEFLLATIAFLSASIGMAQLILGAGLLEKVEISERWRKRP